MPDAKAIPAATVIIMREGVGAPEYLMVERAAAMSFAGGALVFPGGRVDPTDVQLAETLGTCASAVHEVASQIAAVRETLEEAGLAVGVDIGGADARAFGQRLYAGEPLAALLVEVGGALQLDRLTPFARWRPENVKHKIFDTRFYLALAPEGAEPIVDGNENVRLFWASAHDVLAAAACGEAMVIFPTLRNLERLSLYTSFADAVADAAAHPVQTIVPWIEERDGYDHLCIAEDAGYPVTAVPLDQAMRA